MSVLRGDPDTFSHIWVHMGRGPEGEGEKLTKEYEN